MRIIKGITLGGKRMISWNLIGVLLWVVLILYLVFVIQNIRRRRIKMIIKKHKRFTWPDFLLNIVEVLIFLAAGLWLLNQGLFDNPDLNDQSRISAHISYQPLIMSTGKGNSHYVTVRSSTRRNGTQTYTFYRSGTKETVSSNNATIAFGRNSETVAATRIPYSKKKLNEMDRRYQHAYVAIYTAYYKKNWINGIGLHAGHLAEEYYLIRVPDASFIKNKSNNKK